MAAPKRVLCIMDLSCVGRSSLGVAGSVLSACGAQCCPLPTTLFSTHTGGFGEVEIFNAAPFCEAALGHYARESIHFDAVYVGYLLGKAQFTLARHAMRTYPRALKVVDPALGDNGRQYSKITAEMVGWMRELCEMADIITPNFTESALLLGQKPVIEPLAPTMLQERLSALSAQKRQVVITSVPQKEGGMAIFGCDAGGKEPYSITGRYVPQSYPGTGDLYTSALVGLILQGMPVPFAAKHAASFVEAAVNETYRQNGEVRQGVWFEPFLKMLFPQETPQP